VPRMAIARTIRQELRIAAARILSRLPIEGERRPVFIVGCGRSGTSILGTALSKHPRVAYLNEPRHLWFAAFPQSDVWTHRATARRGRLVLAAADANPRQSERLRRLFRSHALIARRPVVVEKLPVNAFRLEFLRTIFPEARFVCIYRNGLEVARSIAADSQQKNWFGTNGYKWDELVRHARASAETRKLPDLCENDVHRGLLEWRLSTESIVQFVRGMPPESHCELSYASFVADPEGTINRVLEFIGARSHEGLTQFVRRSIRRRGIALRLTDATALERTIGGPMLAASFIVDAMTKRAA
jgi:sulfotransferase family protein